MPRPDPAAATVIGPHTLARRLRVAPPLLSTVAAFLANFHVELAFRELVRRVLPTEATRILRAGEHGRDGAPERMWAFCSAFERKYFPVYEVDEIEALMYSIPFQRMGWSYDAFHDLDFRIGTLLLRCLCPEPYASTSGAHVPLLEAVEERANVPRTLLLRVPDDGFTPADLHAALDNTRYSAAAEFADWTWGQTDLAFLDCDEEIEVVDADWTDDNLQELARQWKLARALIDRVANLEVWLEQSPAANFSTLLETVLARLPRHSDQPGSADAEKSVSDAPSNGAAEAHLSLQPATAA